MFSFLKKFVGVVVFSALALVILSAFAHPALAADSGGAATNFSNPKEWMQIFTTFFTGFFQVIIIFIVFISILFATLMGNLMDSSFIFDTGMGETLHLIWTVLRNFVNVGFVLILLLIAVMVILDIGGEKGGIKLLKKILPKFVLALVLVNLTFFAARFILTTNDVLTTAVLTLPRTVGGDHMTQSLPCIDPTTKKMIKDSEACLKQIQKDLSATYTKSLQQNDSLGNTEKEARGTFNKIEAYVKKTWQSQVGEKMGSWIDRKNFPLILLMNMLDLSNLLTWKGQDGDISDAMIASLGALITAGAVGIVYLMLFLAFVVRLVVLWIAIAISPLLALGYVLKELFGIDSKGGGFDIAGEFQKHAFMPVLVSIPLSIGFIMIFAHNTVGYENGHLVSYSTEAGNLSSILWWVASIIVVWYGTNEAIKKSSSFAAKITDKIHGGVNSFVGGVAGTAKYLPIIPGMGSIAAIQRQPEMMQQHARETWSDPAAHKLAKAGGYDTITSKLDEDIEKMKTDPKKGYNDVKSNAGTLMNADKAHNAQRYDFAKNSGINVGDIKPEDMSLEKFEKLLRSTPMVARLDKTGVNVLSELEAAKLAGDVKAPATALQAGATIAKDKAKDVKIDTAKTTAAGLTGNVHVANYLNSTYYVKKEADGSHKVLATEAEITTAKSGVESDLKKGDLANIGAKIEELKKVMEPAQIVGVMNKATEGVSEEVKKKIRLDVDKLKDSGITFDGTKFNA